jgi:fructose-bisphosphate aldolase class II
MTEEISVPVVLHLDHCPEREVISECLKLGWNSVLFDASKLPVEENLRQTKLVVAEAREYGAHVEGEIESITGVEDGIGSEEVDRIQPLEVALNFIAESQVDVFAPAIGNAHGRYLVEPVLDADRVKKIYDATGIPLALHGGSGMSPAQFTELIALGCAKINISTALKEVFMQSSLEYLKKAEETNKWDPLKLFSTVQNAVAGMATEHMRLFGSSGRIQ